jgi:cytochrome P450
MEAVWGPDCQEYMPERWLSEDGRQLRYVPSHKFLAFNSGPRLCRGKDIAITQLKMIIVAVVWNFDMETVDGQTIDTKLSCLLQMKDGLKMKLN